MAAEGPKGDQRAEPVVEVQSLDARAKPSLGAGLCVAEFTLDKFLQ